MMCGIESMVSGYPPEEVVCQPDQIVPGITRAYVGSLLHHVYPQGRIIPIFHTLRDIEIFPSSRLFLERKIRRQSLEIDGRLAGKSVDELVCMFKRDGVSIPGSTTDMLVSTLFTRDPRTVELIWLTVYDLGFTDATRLGDILRRGKDLGLEKCVAEVGPYQRFADNGQQVHRDYFIATDSIPGRNGSPGVFKLGRDRFGRYLSHSWSDPSSSWNPASEFVFSLS